jgi:hypothetical protein
MHNVKWCKHIVGKVLNRAVARRDNWGGGGIFIYSCSHTVKTIDFKRNPSGRTRIYEYTPPPPYYRSSYGPGAKLQNKETGWTPSAALSWKFFTLIYINIYLYKGSHADRYDSPFFTNCTSWLDAETAKIVSREPISSNACFWYFNSDAIFNCNFASMSSTLGDCPSTGPYISEIKIHVKFLSLVTFLSNHLSILSSFCS